MTTSPKTLLEVIHYFSSEATCVEFMCRLRYDLAKPVCPHCGSINIGAIKTRPKYQCREKECRKQFSMKKGTIMEDSALPLTKWLPALWMVANDKNGISSCELARALGITQKSAWFMLMRCREAMKSGTFMKLSGSVEVDETWVGGKGYNMSAARKAKAGITGAGRIQGNKAIVMGMVQRGGALVAKVVDSTRRKDLIPEIEQTIDSGSTVYSDALMSYSTLRLKYDHKFVDHQKKFVDGDIHTNTMENFWCLLKRSIKGTYVQVAPEHLDSYVTEQAFRYNQRKKNDGERFVKVLSQVFDKRLTYKELTGTAIA